MVEGSSVQATFMRGAKWGSVEPKLSYLGSDRTLLYLWAYVKHSVGNPALESYCSHGRIISRFCNRTFQGTCLGQAVRAGSLSLLRTVAEVASIVRRCRAWTSQEQRLKNDAVRAAHKNSASHGMWLSFLDPTAVTGLLVPCSDKHPQDLPPWLSPSPYASHRASR